MVTSSIRLWAWKRLRSANIQAQMNHLSNGGGRGTNKETAIRSTPVKWTLRVGLGSVLVIALPLLSIVVTDSLAGQPAENSGVSGSDDALAESLIARKTWWTALNFGAGALSQSGGGIHQHDTTGFLGFEGGYVVRPQFLVGIELSGWLLEASNTQDPSVGE